MQINMTFVVQKVTRSVTPGENIVEALQQEAAYLNPKYRNCRLELPVIDSDEMKLYGPGSTIQVSFITP